MGANNIIELGIHHEDFTSYATSAIEKDQLMDSKAKVLTATDFSMLLVKDHILFVKIRCTYNSHADLLRTRKMGTEFGRQLLKANP
jgi:hypothetical protein